MITLIEYLTAVREFAKDIHYHAHGESFYAIHLLMDRVADGLYDKIDELKEVCYLGNINEVPQSKDILKVAVAYMPDIVDSNSDNIERLEDLIARTLDHIKEIKNGEPASDSLLDSIAQDLQLKRGLLWRNK